MSTRSLVAVKVNRVITSSYVHFDGYLKGVGDMLLNHYDNQESAIAIAGLGYASSLHSTLAKTIAKTAEHNKDITPNNYESPAAYLADADESWAEFAYLYLDDRWLVAIPGCPQWVELKDAVSGDRVFQRELMTWSNGPTLSSLGVLS